jgi:hypothetical protein
LSVVQVSPSRYEGLTEAVHGYETTGVPLVAYDGQTYKPSGFSDDVGMYDFIPRIAHSLGLSLDQAIDVFFIGIVLASLAAGLLGAFRCFRSWWAKGWAAVMLVVVAFECFGYGSVYIVPPCLAMAVVPWFLSYLRDDRFERGFLLFGFLGGVLLGAGQVVRAQSATPILLFMGCALILDRGRSWVQRAGVLALIVAGFLVPLTYFHTLLDRRDAWLAERQPGYVQPLKQHPKWHSIYIGLGYLPNDLGIVYRDDVATAKVYELDPDSGYLTPRYESVLRGEVARIARERPGFVVRTVLAKLWAMGGHLLLFANVGLLAAAWRPKPRSIEIAFWLALGVSALPGVLVMPYSKYVMGFVAVAALYGVASVGALTVADLRELALRAGVLMRRAGETVERMARPADEEPVIEPGGSAPGAACEPESTSPGKSVHRPPAA